MKNRECVSWDGKKGRLRLANLAADSALYEKILPKERIDTDAVTLIASQLQNIIDGMKTEWDADMDSTELRRSLDLLDRYVQCLRMYSTTDLQEE